MKTLKQLIHEAALYVARNTAPPLPEGTLDIGQYLRELAEPLYTYERRAVGADEWLGIAEEQPGEKVPEVHWQTPEFDEIDWENLNTKSVKSGQAVLLQFTTESRDVK